MKGTRRLNSQNATHSLSPPGTTPRRGQTKIAQGKASPTSVALGHSPHNVFPLSHPVRGAGGEGETRRRLRNRTPNSKLRMSARKGSLKEKEDAQSRERPTIPRRPQIQTI